MDIPLPHFLPEPTSPHAVNGPPDVVFTDGEGLRVVLHKPQLAGIHAQSDDLSERVLRGANYREQTPATLYALIRLNPLPSGPVYTVDTRVPEPEPAHIYERLVKEREK